VTGPAPWRRRSRPTRSARRLRTRGNRGWVAVEFRERHDQARELRQHFAVEAPREIEADVRRQRRSRARSARSSRPWQVAHVQENAQKARHKRSQLLAKSWVNGMIRFGTKVWFQRGADVVAQRNTGEETLREPEQGVVLVEERKREDLRSAAIQVPRTGPCIRRPPSSPAGLEVRDVPDSG